MKKLMFIALVAGVCAAFAENAKPVAVYTKPQMTEEYKAKIAAKRAEWEKKSPEERAKVIAERKAASENNMLARLGQVQSRAEKRMESIRFDYEKGEVIVSYGGGETKTVKFAK